MITEDYVSFETAKLLKEKGFDGYCDTFYDHKKQIISSTWPLTVEHDGAYMDRMGCILCPTLSMVMRWLRDVHGLHIRPDCIGKKNWAVIIQSFDGKDYPLKEINIGFLGIIEEHNYPSCEIAVSAAIKYCLENLI